MNLIDSIKNLGLNEKEAKVYLALLQMGRTTAYYIAVRADLKKPTTYVILDDLIDKGIVQKIPRAKKAMYTAIDPSELLSMVKSKLENATEALPELKALSQKGRKYKIGASYYEGMNSIREMYNKMIKTMTGKEYVAFFAHAEDASPELMSYFDELNEQMRKAGVKRKGITVQHSSLRKFLDKEYAKKYNVKLKTLPQEVYNSNISIEIFNNYTQIFSHHYLQATVIDNPDVANVMRQIFELVWERDDIVVKTN